MLFLGGHLGDIGNILNFGHIGNYFAEFYSVWIRYSGSGIEWPRTLKISAPYTLNIYKTYNNIYLTVWPGKNPTLAAPPLLSMVSLLLKVYWLEKFVIKYLTLLTCLKCIDVGLGEEGDRFLQ